MDDSVKKRFVAALRSGDYPQAWGRMRRRRGPLEFVRSKLDRNRKEPMCALGVLCDVVNPNAWHYWNAGLWTHCDGVSTKLPSREVRDVAGISEHEAHTIAVMNDLSPRGSFQRIADWVEKNL